MFLSLQPLSQVFYNQCHVLESLHPLLAFARPSHGSCAHVRSKRSCAYICTYHMFIYIYCLQRVLVLKWCPSSTGKPAGLLSLGLLSLDRSHSSSNVWASKLKRSMHIDEKNMMHYFTSGHPPDICAHMLDLGMHLPFHWAALPATCLACASLQVPKRTQLCAAGKRRGNWFFPMAPVVTCIMCIYIYIVFWYRYVFLSTYQKIIYCMYAFYIHICIYVFKTVVIFQ